MERPTVATRWNLDLLEDYYARWRNDPASVEDSWRIFFEGYDLVRLVVQSTLMQRGLRRPSRA